MKKALLIGIDYVDTKMASNFNTHDVKRIHNDILSDFNVQILTDDVSPSNNRYCNYENIMRSINSFITDEPNVEYLFVYCGNSRDRYDKVKDEDGERLPQTLKVLPGILPRGKETEVITSNDLRKLLIDKLPNSCSLTCIISANYGHELIPTRFEYNFKRSKFNGDCDLYGDIDKNVLVIAFSSDEYTPVEMKLSSMNKEPIYGSLGIFAFIGLYMDTTQYEGEITRDGWFQALLKKLVANNPSKIQTYNMMTIGSEEQNIRNENFYIF